MKETTSAVSLTSETTKRVDATAAVSSKISSIQKQYSNSPPVVDQNAYHASNVHHSSHHMSRHSSFNYNYSHHHQYPPMVPPYPGHDYYAGGGGYHEGAYYNENSYYEGSLKRNKSASSILPPSHYE
jgi:hypothetical protein